MTPIPGAIDPARLILVNRTLTLSLLHISRQIFIQRGGNKMQSRQNKSSFIVHFTSIQLTIHKKPTVLVCLKHYI